MLDKQSYQEKELFQRIAEGDEQAFEQMFYRFLPTLQIVVRRMIKQEGVVNDIIQDVFMRVWINRDKLPEIENPDRWVFRIAFNCALNWLERRALQQNQEKKFASKSFDNNTEEAINLIDTRRLVQEAVSQLAPQTQRIYQLSRESGLKIHEIAEKLNLSPNTVKNTLVRAAKQIREYLKEHGIVVPLFLLTADLFSMALVLN